jgi:hypothetical protein
VKESALQNYHDYLDTTQMQSRLSMKDKYESLAAFTEFTFDTAYRFYYYLMLQSRNV